MDKQTHNLITSNASRQVAKAENLVVFKKVKSWQELATALGIVIDPALTQGPFNYSSFKAWAHVWKETALARAAAENNIAVVKAAAKPKLTISKSTTTYNKVTLFPEQQSVVDKLKEIFWSDPYLSRIAVQDGDTGSGKTFVAAALIHHIIENKLWRDPNNPAAIDLPYRIMVLTPKSVIESYKRVLEAFGLGMYLGNILLVTSYSQMTSTYGSIFYTESFDPYAEDPDEPIIKPNGVFLPYFLIADECHRLNNPSSKQTKVVRALLAARPPLRCLAMSATPWVSVNDSRLVVTSSNKRFFGMNVTDENFNIFAKNLAKEPNKPNIEAAKRLRAQLDDIIVSFPRVKWKSKAINQVLIVDFEKQAHREAAEAAYEIFLERKTKAGENTKFGRFEEYIAQGQYRKAVEPFRVPAMVEFSLDAINKRGKAIVIGAAFRKTITEAALRFKQLGYTRNQISIIWGGKREWNKKLLLTPEELNELVARGCSGEQLHPFEIRQLKESLDYQSERILAAESAEEQAARIQIEKEFNLTGAQSADQRQREIDKFQTGESLICLFTLPAGGVGLSLDQCTADLRPREGLFTPSYSGPEFKQALGRTIRRATVENVYQYMCYMKGTIEETHVAPKVDKKLKCIAAVTGNVFNLFDLDTAVKYQHAYRTTEEAIKDAEDLDSQFQSADDTDNDNDDDN